MKKTNYQKYSCTNKDYIKNHLFCFLINLTDIDKDTQLFLYNNFRAIFIHGFMVEFLAIF